MSLLSARYKVITLRIHVGYLSTCGLQACLVSVLKTDPFSESFVKNFIEFSFHAEFLHFPFLLPTRFEDMRVTKILKCICAALRAMNYIAAIHVITYPQSHCEKNKTFPTYRMQTNNKASSSESGKFKVISLATEFDLIFIYKMLRNKIP